MEIVSTSHMYMEDKFLNPDPRVCGSVVRLYVHWFESLWEFMIQYLIGETLWVCGTPVLGCAIVFGRLLYSVLFVYRSVLPRSIDGSGRAGFLTQVLT